MKYKIILGALAVIAVQHNCFAQDGGLDTSFGTGGKVITDIGGDDDGNAMVLQSDGKIIVAGTFVEEDEEDGGMALARYVSDGTLDETFGDGGIVTISIEGGELECNDVLVQSDGKILAVGWAYIYDDEEDIVEFAVARFNTDGSPDLTYGEDGLSTIDAAGLNYPDGGFAGALQPDDKLVVLGLQEQEIIMEMVLTRLNTDGTLDDSFGEDGAVQPLDLLYNEDSEDMNVAIANDGKIIVSASELDETEEYSNFWLGRYNTDGSVDETFGDEGKTITDIGVVAFDLSSYDVAKGMTLTEDGKIIVCGDSFGDDQSLALVRYTADGELDEDFGTDGVSVIERSSDYTATAVTLQDDGKILVSGDWFVLDESRTFNIVRCLNDGGVDETFGDMGTVSTNFGTGEDLANDIVVNTTSGKIIVAGESDDAEGNSDFALAQYFVEFDDASIASIDKVKQLVLYPNPVAGQFVLNYELSEADVVSVELIDIQGRGVVTFVNQEQRSAGLQNEQLVIPAGLASGTYELVLKTESGISSTRLMH